MQLFHRLARAAKAGRDATLDDATASPVVAVLVIGPGPGEMVAAQAWLRAARQTRAILITDQTRVELFQTPDVVTEFLPTGGWSTADPARKLYVQRRLSLILTKWAVTRCAAIGPQAEALLALVSAPGGAGQSTTKPAKAATG